MNRFSRWSVTVLLSGALWPFLAAGQEARNTLELTTSAPGWAADLRGATAGESVRLQDVSSPLGLANSLTLRQFKVVAPGATVVVHGSSGEERLPFPERRYFRGQIDNAPDSLVMLSVGPDGDVRGMGRTDGGNLTLTEGADQSLAMQYVDVSSVSEAFSCGNDTLSPPPRSKQDESTLDAKAIAAAIPKNTVAYEAKIAIETDVEFFNKFGNTIDATDYVTDLVAYASTIYSDEVSTSIVISELSLWDSGTDPWEQTSSSCAFYEFGKYWNDNNSSVDRSLAHFLSGKNSNSGIAWVGVLCQGSFNVNLDGACPGLTDISNYGGDYGVSMGLDANFEPGNPTNTIWDSIVFAHEVGHNFNSRHTHCYEGVGGNANAVDECYVQSGNGCYSGPTSLPAGCGGTGQGCGTLMSYCHLSFAGGLSNIGFTLGANSAFGVEPERVPNRMFDHVVSRSNANPSCLVSVPAVSVTLSGPSSVTEGDSVDVTLTLSEAVGSAVTIDLGVGAELQGLVGNLTGHTLDAGNTELIVTLTTAENTADEPDIMGELFIDTVTSTESVGTGSPSNLQLTVIDDDIAPVVAQLGLSAGSAAEGGSVEATVSLDQATSVDVAVSVGLDGDLPGLTSSSLGPQTIAAGDTSTMFTLVFDDDAVSTGDRSGNVSIATLTSDAATSMGDPASAALWIIDDEVSLSMAGGGTVTEGDTVSVELVLDRAIDEAVAVDLAASAELGGSISGLTGLSIAAGTTSLMAVLSTTDNNSVDGDLSGTVSISSATSAGRNVLSGDPQEVVITVLDNDAPPVVLTITGSDRVYEGDPIEIIVTLDQATTVDVSVTLAADLALPLSTGADLGPHTISAGLTEVMIFLPTDLDPVGSDDYVGNISIGSVSSETVATSGSPSAVGVTVVDLQPGELFDDGFETR